MVTIPPQLPGIDHESNQVKGIVGLQLVDEDNGKGDEQLDDDDSRPDPSIAIAMKVNDTDVGEGHEDGAVLLWWTRTMIRIGVILVMMVVALSIDLGVSLPQSNSHAGDMRDEMLAIRSLPTCLCKTQPYSRLGPWRRQVHEHCVDAITNCRNDNMVHVKEEERRAATPQQKSLGIDDPTHIFDGKLMFGLGDDVDQCMESRFHNGDLDGDCKDAVQTFFLAVNDRTLIHPSNPRPTKCNPFPLTLMYEEARMARRHRFFTIKADELDLFWLPTLMLLLLLALGKIRGGFGDVDKEEEDARDVTFDYVKMPEVENGIEYVAGRMKNANASEPEVYIGVPV